MTVALMISPVRGSVTDPPDEPEAPDLPGFPLQQFVGSNVRLALEVLAILVFAIPPQQ